LPIKFAEENGFEIEATGRMQGGSRILNLESKEGEGQNIIFVMDKESAYTGGSSYNYKCIYNE
jgi:hypothetical protein